MIHASNKTRPSARVCLLGGVFQAIVLAFYALNFNTAILRLTPDDTYYYLKIATNINNGLGSVFSVGEPTNGYHPLWMGLLVVVHRLVNPTNEQFVVLTLALGVICNVAAGYMFSRLLRAIGFSAQQSLLGVGLFLCTPEDYQQMRLPGPRKRLCITDAGMAGYYSQHEVVNIDGVVNNHAAAYIAAGRFTEYTTLKGCDEVIVDPARLTFYDRNMR